MKRILFSVYSILIASCAFAQSATQVLDKAIAVFNNSQGITADYVITAGQGSSAGKIDMCGNKFRIVSDDMICWYDGTSQWTYSTISDEVSVTTPTLEEMQMSNPYIAITTLKKTCHIYKAYTQIEGFYTLKLVPKDDQSIKQILVYLENNTYNVSKVYFEMMDGNNYRTVISNYKTTRFSDGIFNYDKTMVPAGTEVVDLR